MPLPSIEQAKQLALEFCQPPRFAQMITLNGDGELRGRTLGAGLKPDFTVDIVAWNTFARSNQVRNNPNVMLIWNDGREGGRQSPSSGGESRGIPRVVFAIGTGSVIEGEALRDWYQKRLENHPPIRGMSVEQAVEQVTVVRFQAKRLRLEGFSADGSPLGFDEVTTGLSFVL